MLNVGKSFQYKGRLVKLSPHEFITLLKIRMASAGISGFKLISDLAKMFAGSWAPQSGTIYPILKRLVDEKKLIHEKDEKTPIGPAVKVYKVNEDVGALIDSVLMEHYKSDMDFFGNYVDLLFENFEHSVKAGLIPASIGSQVQAVINELVKKLQATSTKFGGLEYNPPPVEITCPKCKELVDRIAKFCPSCGSELNTKA
nr:helix-turn-helix transcriptional regulator [Candidatus Sigynarchaeum springense]MDO8116872.1 helix-turn-helix transcriptional regulator [Candidatus Sigynarchaeota archaeon]